MQIQTVIPTQSTVTVMVPDEYLNCPLEVVLIPKEFADDPETRRKQVREFFSQFNADASQLKYSRDELYDR